LENFPVLPVVTSDPYGYGVPDPYDAPDDAKSTSSVKKATKQTVAAK